MLCADFVPRSDNPALKKRESGFNGVGMNVSVNVLAFAVDNRFVILDACLFHGDGIRAGIVSEDDFHVLADIVADVLGQCPRLRVLSMEEAKIAVALADADHYFLVVHASDAALPLVHAADVSGVHFDFSVHHRLVGLRHCVTDAMAEVPRCLVASNSERALNLAGAHALLRFTEEQRRNKPLRQGQVRIVEHGASGDGELVVTVFAVEEMFFGFEQRDWPFAAQAARPFGEAQTGQQFAAFGIRRKHGIYIH